MKAVAYAPGWEVIHGEVNNRVRRIRVVGGWLYQADVVTPPNGYQWSPPVFVPAQIDITRGPLLADD